MEDKYVDELKEKINSLTPEEKEKRDEYLTRLGPRPDYSKLTEEEIKKLEEVQKRAVPDGKVIQGPTTGYASIDKPQSIFYRNVPYKQYKTDTIYGMIFHEGFDPNKVILRFDNQTYTIGQLKEITDNIADHLIENNIGDGDRILFGVANCIESIASFLASNKIGACAKMVDIRAGKDEIKEYANTSNCNAMVAFSMIIDKVEEVIDETNLEKVLYVNPTANMSKVKQFAAKFVHPELMKKLPDDSRFVDIEEFKKTVKSGIKSEPVPLYENGIVRESAIVQSSGTTGKPKSIVHTDLSFANLANEIAYSDLPLTENKKILVALPPWIAYGLYNAILYPMLAGCEVILCENFDPDAVFKHIGEFDTAFCAPFHCRYIEKNYEKLSKKQKEQLSKADSLIVGGDKISKEENKGFEDKFGTKVLNGYGSNEQLGVATVNPLNYNGYGTAGIPKHDEAIYPVDENGRELPIGQEGQLYSYSNTRFVEYENNPEKTKEIVKETPYGTAIDTRDIGKINELGFAEISGRADRVIVRLGFKINAKTIEDNISANEIVSECLTVGVPDEDEEQVPFTFVVLKDNVNLGEEDIKNIILEKCRSELKEYELPKHIVIVPELPYTPNNKYDFKKAEQNAIEYLENQNSYGKKR